MGIAENSGRAMGWKKGQSGNPGGRPKAVVKVRELAREQTEMAIKTLTEIAKEGENEGARTRAAEALLDRGWGKSTQFIDATVTDDRPPRERTDAELEAILDEGETDGET